MDEQNKKQISLDLKPEVARGAYSNLAIITHSRSEFIVDFATVLPGLPKPEISNRIIMTPEHAKRLLNALQDNIIKYENIYGIIDLEQPRREGGPQQGGATFDLGGFGPFGGGPVKN